MGQQQNREKKLDGVIGNYKAIRECLTGLTDILNISFNDKDIFRQAGIDNLKILHINVLAVLRKSYTPREVRIRMREIEFDEKETEVVFPL
ncbi:hypothetical protein LCGC14_0625700 [marine sediment metagenome]|uniref:Uncharacterized protein n=1 Tax=marine sediment metagenome TaxID=412755 RepID=A0A0F9R3G8_9ZZZZ